MPPVSPVLRTRAIVILVLLALVVSFHGSAISVKFVDRSLAGVSDIEVYNITGYHIGTYNTSSEFYTDESVIIDILPQNVDYIKNPISFLNDTAAFVEDNLVGIAILALFLGFIISRGGRS